MVNCVPNRTLVFDLIIAIIMGIFFVLTLTYNKTARFVPLIIATPTFALALGRLIYDLRLWWLARKSSGNSSGVTGSFVWRKELNAVFWVLLFFGLVYLIGFFVAIPLYIFVSMRYRSQEPWAISILVPLGSWAFMYGLFSWLLKIQLFEGILVQLLRG